MPGGTGLGEGGKQDIGARHTGGGWARSGRWTLIKVIDHRGVNKDFDIFFKTEQLFKEKQSKRNNFRVDSLEACIAKLVS